MFYVNILYDKTFFEILILFQFFLNIIEYDYFRCICLRINNNNKFFENVFTIYRKKRDIIIKFLIVENFQINKYIERFNSIIMRKINIFLKNSKLFIK